MNVKTASALALTLVVAVATGCGTRVGGTDTSADASSRLSPPTSTTETTDTSDTTDVPPDDSPCGPGDATGATDVGVTDATITLYTIHDLSGPAPGLFQANQDAMKAFVAYCNSLGGVNGRKLELVTRDSGFFEPRPQIVDACRDAFAVVGGAVVFDDQMMDVAAECGIPELPSFSSTPQHSRAPNVVHAVPNSATEWQAGPAYWFAEQFPEAVKRAAVLYADAGTTKDRAQMQEEAFRQAGFDFVMKKAIPLVELNWGPHVDELRSKGIGYVTIWSDLKEPVKLVKELRAQGVDVTIVDVEPQSYTSDFLEQAGPAAEGAYVGVSTWPLEEAADNPELQLYGDWVERTTGSEPTALGIHTWSSALLFATAAKELGGDLTREGLLDYLSSVHEWDGHGIHAPTDPGRNHLAECIVMLQVQEGEFRRVWPDEGFACDPRYAAKVSDPSGGG